MRRSKVTIEAKFNENNRNIIRDFTPDYWYQVAKRDRVARNTIFEIKCTRSSFCSILRGYLGSKAMIISGVNDDAVTSLMGAKFITSNNNIYKLRVIKEDV